MTQKSFRSTKIYEVWKHLRWTVTSLPLYSLELALLFNIALGAAAAAADASIETSLTIGSVNVLKFLDDFESVSCESIRNNSHLFGTNVVSVEIFLFLRIGLFEINKLGVLQIQLYICNTFAVCMFCFRF